MPRTDAAPLTRRRAAPGGAVRCPAVTAGRGGGMGRQLDPPHGTRGRVRRVRPGQRVWPADELAVTPREPDGGDGHERAAEPAGELREQHPMRAPPPTATTMSGAVPPERGPRPWGERRGLPYRINRE